MYFQSAASRILPSLSLAPCTGLLRPSVWATAFLMAIFSSSVFAADAPAKRVVDLAKGKTASAACAACHGVDGNSAIAQNPSLAGQHADYLAKQLHNFRIKPGAKEPERNNAIMAGFAAMLSPQDILNVSAFYASQAPKPVAPKRKDLVDAGKKIYFAGVPERGVPSCAGCHGPGGAGIPAQYPRLAGQHPEYTEAQLLGFKTGQRKNNAQMMSIAANMSEREIAAVSEYIAAIR